jgi:hypothetical protein
MFRLIRLLISVAMTAAFVWFAVTVPLGKHTLWGHLVAIFSTPQAKDLAEGTREEAHKVVDRIREERHPPDMAQPAPASESHAAPHTPSAHKPSAPKKPHQ